MADDRFYVKSLRMQNFRCFEDVELGPFDPHFNLLVGENGAGKSSVLVALARLFSQLSTTVSESTSLDLVGRADIRLEHSVNRDGVTSLKSMGYFVLSAQAFGDSQSLQIVDSIGGLVANPSHNPRILDEKSGTVRTLGRNVDGRLLDRTCPLIVLYRTARAFSACQNREDSSQSRWRMRESAFRSWADGGLAANDLRSWFQNETLASYQSLQRESQGGAAEVRILPMVVNAVLAAFDETEYIEYEADLEDIVVTFLDGRRTSFSRMSDGQRALIGLVADLARRAAVLNVFYLGKRTLEETPGLVLIDEIDLHLHPKWQRQIVPALKKVFPKIQFFATTHSPQVIGECKPEEIVLLTPQGQKKYVPGSYGMDSNWILECVMGAEGRNPEIAKRIKSLFDLIESDRLDEAKSEIHRLREELPEVAPDIVAAESYIWNLEHAGDEAAE